MAVPEYCLIATAIGPVGLAWSGQGLVRLQLPYADAATTIERLIRRLVEPIEAHPPAWLEPAVVRLQRYFTGARVDFSDTPLDFDGVPELRQRLYRELLCTGWGQTITYGELAERLGSPAGAQAVGQGMGKNPVPVIVPCHRVLAAGNKPGGFSAPGGTSTKLRLLELEGVRPGGRDKPQMAFAF
jgi:methylated-DNA-[protein]-cysteine S-methyltransferase